MNGIMTFLKQSVKNSTLKLLGNVSVNHKGKDECIKEQVIDAVWPYLSSEVLQEKIYAAFTLMSCAIHLHGKFQIVQKTDSEGSPNILQVLTFFLLIPKNNQTLCELSEID